MVILFEREKFTPIGPFLRPFLPREISYSYIPIPKPKHSMYGFFTYILPPKLPKCRSIHHTLSVWKNAGLEKCISGFKYGVIVGIDSWNISGFCLKPHDSIFFRPLQTSWGWYQQCHWCWKLHGPTLGMSWHFLGGSFLSPKRWGS